MKLGRNVARTFLDYYKLLGYISTKPSSGLLPKPSHHSAKERKHQENRAASEPLRQTIDERFAQNIMFIRRWSLNLTKKDVSVALCVGGKGK